MILKELESLLNESNLDQFQEKLNQYISNEDLFKTFENGDTLYHRVVKLKTMPETIKIKFLFKLSDAGLDINLKNKSKQQTCLHLAVIEGLLDVVYCLLQNGADLTITDHFGLCAYNHARRLDDKELSKKIILKMQHFYPTYWVGIESMDINIIRKLVNSWCKFKIKKNGKYLIDYAIEKGFKQAYELFNSLDKQMDLCWAVFACNISKVKSIIENDSNLLKMSFRNMKEHNASILFYAIKQNNFNLLKALLITKPNILSEYISDDLDIDYPLYFVALKSNLDEQCIKLLTPELIDLVSTFTDISCLYYKGMSLLRYTIEIDLDLKKLEILMSSKYCSKELITVKDPDYLTSREYAIKAKKYEYVDLIDKITIDYILNSKVLRMQLALNGFNFSTNNLKYNGIDLLTYAKENNLSELIMFLENVDIYQDKINYFHTSVEKNDYYAVKSSFKCEFSQPELNCIFINNLIISKKKNESQSVLFKAVLNGYFEILNLLLDLILEDPNKSSIRLDFIRDHCYRTPMHYANGYNDNKKMYQLLSQFGFSDNVFDKDGMTPLDFQERINSEEVQELMKIHKLKQFTLTEPNPWSWQVWTRIQREKDTLKQLISVHHPHLNIQSHSHDHSNNHSYNHAFSNETESTPNCLIL